MVSALAHCCHGSAPDLAAQPAGTGVSPAQLGGWCCPQGLWENFLSAAAVPRAGCALCLLQLSHTERKIT